MLECIANFQIAFSKKTCLSASLATAVFFSNATFSFGSNSATFDGTVEFNLHQPSVKAEDVEDESQENAGEVKLAGEEEQEHEGTFLAEAQPQHIENNRRSHPASSTLLQGGVTYTVKAGTPIKLKLASVPSHPISLINRDMDGNLYPARLGQQITARTVEDIYVGKNKIIPEGTVLHGCVSKILPPRRVYRAGSLEISFDYLTTPDGKRFAFSAEANNAKASTFKTKAKGFGIIAAHAAGGAAVGVIVAYQLFGPEKTLAMHGYNIAGGAAAGALLATGYAVMRKGPKAVLEPGDDLNMVIDTDLLMPAAIDQSNKVVEESEVHIKIEKTKVVGDGVGGHFVTIDAILTNESDTNLSSIDLFLEDTNGNRVPLCSSPEENSHFLFHLDAHSEKHVHLSFLTPYPKLKQNLVWVDHETKLALVKQKIY